MVSSLLSDADAREVEAAVARVESQTSAELVVAVVPRSSDYWQTRALLAVAWALASGLAYLYFAPWHEPAWALVVQVLVGGAAFALAGLPVLQRRLISPEVAAQAAQARAFQLFAERGLHGTSARTALLVFISELEHRVVMLGDHSIHSQLGQQGWDEDVAILLEHIRKGQTRAGLIAVLERLAPQLARVAPREAHDVNELPDAVLRS
jgi:putative membrane protein